MRAKKVFLPSLLSQVEWEEQVSAELKGCEGAGSSAAAARANRCKKRTLSAGFCTGAGIAEKQ